MDDQNLTKLKSFLSSYPTYEEWKLGKGNWQIVYNRVLILPMRNGNTIIGSTYPNSSKVLILPMRNGN